MEKKSLGDINQILRGNAYPGRGIIIGRSADGKNAVLTYFIMGRSENSRNRVFREENDQITIYPFDENKVEDPTLIIYSPVRRVWNKWIVTNGDQTDTVFDSLVAGESFEQALDKRCFEPDCPNFTPRISGLADLTERFSYKLSILKNTDGRGEACGRFCFSYDAVPGTGHFIHTYRCDGNPIPSFEGEPEAITIPDDIDEFAGGVWDSLNADNKVSLFVAFIDVETGAKQTRIYNKSEA